MRLAGAALTKGALAVLALAALASLSVGVVVGAGLSVWRGSSAQRAVGVLPERAPRPAPGGVVTIPTRPTPSRLAVPPHQSGPSVAAPPAPLDVQPQTRRPARQVRHPVRHAQRPSQPTGPSQPTQPAPPAEPPQAPAPPGPVVRPPGPPATPAWPDVVTPPATEENADGDDAAVDAAQPAEERPKAAVEPAEKLPWEHAKAWKDLVHERADISMAPIESPEGPKPGGPEHAHEHGQPGRQNGSFGFGDD